MVGLQFSRPDGSTVKPGGEGIGSRDSSVEGVRKRRGRPSGLIAGVW